VGYPKGQVDIPGLAKVGDNVLQAAEAFEKAFSAHTAALDPGSTMTGWATGAALPGATQAWSTFIKGLAGQVASFGAGLTKASNDYAATDSAAAARIGTAGAGIPAGHPAWAGVFGQASR
jgi:hypothetical protein